LSLFLILEEAIATSLEVVLDQWKACACKLLDYSKLIEEIIDLNALLKKSSPSLPTAVTKIWPDKWLKVRSSLLSELLTCDAEMVSTRGSIVDENLRVAQIASVDSKVIHLESNSTHGIHFRVTKRDSKTILSKLKSESVSILSTQKAGSLFRTAKVIALRDSLQ